jgi:hypothetical protein
VVGYVGLWGDSQLRDILHILFCAVHVVDITGGCTTTISGEVARFSTVEAESFWVRAARFFLELCGLCNHCICVRIIPLMLVLVVGCSSVRYVHGDLHVIICGLWGISRVIGGSLLLLLLWLPLLLVLLRMHSPGPWLELSSVLPESIIEGPRIWESPSGPDEFYHLPAFCDFDCLVLIFIVCHGEWGPYDLI